MTYNKVNNIIGWAIFGIATIVYLLSMAPTASFWDCGEFIACANELQVPHPPGAPFFLILGRFFAMFASGPESVAYMVNLVSVFAGSFCVLFVFWTTTYLAKKLLAPTEDNPQGQSLIAIMFAGAVGGLVCTFADSLWFNAVEAEVYALSSFFTAIVVWLMFKWEARADEPDNMKWLVLIAFVMGMSIGAHLLNLLTVPALAFIYYFRKYEFSWAGAIATFALSVGILGFIQYGVIQMSVEIAWGFEKMLTGVEELSSGVAANRSGMGLPLGTGVIVFLILTLGGLTLLTVVTQSEKLYNRFFKLFKNIPVLKFLSNIKSRVILNTIAWSLVMIVIGYSSYSMIVIRAGAGTPINENDPSSVASMLSYLKREQYGDRPLIRGVRYNDLSPRNQMLVEERRAFVNLKEPRLLSDGTYTLADGKSLTVKGNKVSGFSATPNDGDNYLGELKDGRKIRIDTKTNQAFRVEDRYLWNGYKQDVDYKDGHVFFPRMHSGQGNHYKGEFGYGAYTKRKGPTDSPFDDKPSIGDDVRFFFDYQIRHMYFRYFMWNFAGREGDIQDQGWESGLEFWRFGDLPAEKANHPGRNHYYLLPLLLGLFGAVYQFLRNPKDATNILLLFFFTGIAIIIYLNQTPYQPRERDYSYAGSFQTFAIWVGLGVIALYDLLQNVMKNVAGYVSGGLAFLLVPMVMGYQNWDDHTRHQRYVAPDSAYNLLNSVEKNGILFTNGDNDTFPLWYIQEVEGIRTDVRVVNLSLLNTDWYIDQMKLQQNESPPLPISAKQIDYLGDRNAIRGWKRGTPVNLEVNLAAILADKEQTLIKDGYEQFAVSPLTWAPSVRGGERSYLLKQDWIILDILVNNARNGWKRPIYFSSTIPPSSYIGLQPFFQVEALANRVVPVDFTKLPSWEDPYSRRQGRFDPDISYDKLMNEFRYRELDNPDLYIDDHIRRTIVGNLVSMIFRTANAFVGLAEYNENQNKAMEAMMGAIDPETAPGQRDSLQAAISANAAVSKDYRKKAEEVLMMCETKITDAARGYDVIYPMFSGMVWQRLNKPEKAKEYYEKVISKAEAWVAYKKAHDEKLEDYDRVVSTAQYVIGQGRTMKAYDLAARAAAIMFYETKDPQYQQMEQQFRGLVGTEGTPTPAPGGQ